VSRSLRFALCLAALPAAVSAATFTVTTTADSGPGSLRQAILDANAATDADQIVFAIPGSGVQTIALGSALPEIVAPVTIDGYTQAGSSANTLDVGSNAVLLVEVTGSNIVLRASNLSGSTIRGLVLNGGGLILNFADSLHPVGHNHIEGCFLGTTPDGSAASPHGASGISIVSWANTIGGPDPADRNVISNGGVSIQSSKENTVTNNLIGTDATGSFAIPDGGVGIHGGSPFFATYNEVSHNVISGSAGAGVLIGPECDGSSVFNNLIGTDATGTLPIPNGGAGISMGYAGSISVGGNVVAFNTGAGIEAWQGPYSISGGAVNDNGWAGIEFSGAVKIQGVSIHDNGGLGIDAGADNSVTPGYPMLASAFPDGSGSTTIQGLAVGPPNASVTLEFFSSPACDSSGFGEGATFLASQAFQTDGGGQVLFTATVPLIPDGLNATATSTFGGVTSEFSNCLSVPSPSFGIAGIGPRSGPAGGGTAMAVNGGGFLPGATVSIGGVEIGGIVNPTDITAFSPVLPPGTLNDVTVTNPGGATATLPAAWFADFLDVAQDDPFHIAVEELVRRGTTAGCGSGHYCPSSPVSREQMAVMLLRAEHGSAYVPPACTGIFADVPCPSPYADWIEELVIEDVSGGCGLGYFCPSDPVRRDQMAPLLLRARYGSAYAPPLCIGTFADVSCPSMFADWVEELAAERITVGCGDGNYCPSAPVSRGQMAVFLVKTFPAP
jgi:hypothetical protein